MVFATSEPTLVNCLKSNIFALTKLRWLKEVFLSADKSGDGLLSVDEVFALMHKLNVKISNRKLREAFKVCVYNL